MSVSAVLYTSKKLKKGDIRFSATNRPFFSKYLFPFSERDKPHTIRLYASKVLELGNSDKNDVIPYRTHRKP